MKRFADDGDRSGHHGVAVHRDPSFRPNKHSASFHPNGELPQSASFIDVDPPNILVTALKQAEDGGGLILRAWESTGASSHARLSLPPFNRSFSAGFTPFELKTFLIPSDPSLPIREVNLIEE